MSTEGSAGKMKHVTLNILQKLEIIRRLVISESQKVVMFSYTIGLSTIYNIKKQTD
jgi:hypothetical protein